MRSEKEKRALQVKIQVPLLFGDIPLSHLTSAAREPTLAYRAMIRREAVLLNRFLQVKLNSKKRGDVREQFDSARWVLMFIKKIKYLNDDAEKPQFSWREYLIPM